MKRLLILLCTIICNTVPLLLCGSFILKAQIATNFARAYNDGTKQFEYVKNTKVSVLVVENTHDTRPIMCTYIIQNKEFGYTDQIRSKTGHTDKIYPGEKFVAYKGADYKFIYIKKAWFVNE